MSGQDIDGGYAVAPFTGAWIEILTLWGLNRPEPSLPLRERGLKCFGQAQRKPEDRSLPLRERGLK